eukprot:COSAG04_NODE_16109_length_509_cov_1.456098_1_plen_56_part_10
MASAEELADLRDRLGALGDDPKKANINKLARAVDEAIGGEPIKRTERGHVTKRPIL